MAVLPVIRDNDVLTHFHKPLIFVLAHHQSLKPVAWSLYIQINPFRRLLYVLPPLKRLKNNIKFNNMKTIHLHSIWVVFFALFILVITGCDRDDDATPSDTGVREGEGLSESDVEHDQGTIGLSISSRSIARKGYEPVTADITVDATTGDFSQAVPIDSLSNIAYLKFNNEDLTSEQRQELSDGVDVSVRILDEKGDLLEEENLSKVSFRSSPPNNEIRADDLADLYTDVHLREDVRYYMQITEKGNTDIYGAPSSEYYEYTGGVTSYIHVRKTEDLDYNSDFPDDNTTFYFQKIQELPENDIYAIYIKKGSKLFYWHIKLEGKRVGIQNRLNHQLNGGNTDPTDFPNYHFTIEKVEDGIYTIQSVLYDNPLVFESSDRNILKVQEDPDGGETAYFRMLLFDIDWDIQTIGYKHLQPVLPPSQTSFAFNSTLINCSSGELSQVVGVSESRESKSISSWEESMSVSSSSEASVSVTIGAEVETGFFGNKGKVSSSVTGSYTTSTSRTSTQTRSAALEKTETVVVSAERTITVPPGNATLVSDIYQSYENVRIPFVQRFRVKGTYREDGTVLSGEEILTQFSFNGFTGVVTEVGGDYIEVTVRGTNVIDRLIDTKTVAEDTPADCNS